MREDHHCIQMLKAIRDAAQEAIDQGLKVDEDAEDWGSDPEWRLWCVKMNMLSTRVSEMQESIETTKKGEEGGIL